MREGANTEFSSWSAHLFSPAAAPGHTLSQGASQVGAIGPADLQQRFPKTFLECIVVPSSNWVKCMDPDTGGQYQDC